jgi:hypothetical protein
VGKKLPAVNILDFIEKKLSVRGRKVRYNIPKSSFLMSEILSTSKLMKNISSIE